MRILIIFLLISTQVSAKNYIHLGMWSKHFSDSGLNERHNLIGIEIDNNFIYKFKNSHNDTAYYAGKIKRDGVCSGKLCLGYSYGVMQGYEFSNVTPIVFGVISYEVDGIGADITCLPKVVCAIQFKFSDEVFDWTGIDAPWDSEGYFEISLDHYDPDYSNLLGFDKNNGVSYDFKLYTTDSTYMKANYTTTVSNTALERGTYVSRRENPPSKIYSQGAIELWNEYDNYNLGVSYNQIFIQRNITNQDTGIFSAHKKSHHTGIGLHISKSFMPSENIEIYTEVAIIERSVVDLKMIGEIKYKLNEQYSLILRTVDWERVNYSQYQLGLRYNF